VNPCAFQMRRTALALMPLAGAITSAVQWVVSVGGSANVSATTRSATSGRSPGPRLILQEAVNAFFHEALPLAPNAGLGRAGLARDFVGAAVVGAQRYNDSSPNVLLRRVTVLGDHFKPTAIPCVILIVIPLHMR
jgi:hypothetical protein